MTETTFQIAQDEYPLAGTTLEIRGAPLWFTISGTIGVKKQPSGPPWPLFYLWSTSELDIDVMVSVVGMRENETDLIVDTIQLAGQTVKFLPFYTYIQSITKAFPAIAVPPVELTLSRGDIQFAYNPPGGPLPLQPFMQLRPWESGRDYRQVIFWPTPAQAETVRMPYIRRPLKLTQDSDGLPDGWWPAIFEEMVIGWRVQNGEVAIDANIPRPCLRDLVSFENQTRPKIGKRAWSMRPWPQ